MKNTEQTEKYNQEQEQIKALLKEISVGLKKHEQKTQTKGIYWGHVGDLKDIKSTLADIKDRLHGSGEYALDN